MRKRGPYGAKEDNKYPTPQNTKDPITQKKITPKHIANGRAIQAPCCHQYILLKGLTEWLQEQIQRDRPEENKPIIEMAVMMQYQTLVVCMSDVEGIDVEQAKRIAKKLCPVDSLCPYCQTHKEEKLTGSIRKPLAWPFLLVALRNEIIRRSLKETLINLAC